MKSLGDVTTNWVMAFMIFGLLDDKSEIQSLRFDKEKFTVDEAKEFLKERRFRVLKFEPAIEERHMDKRHIMDVEETEDSTLSSLPRQCNRSPTRKKRRWNLWQTLT